MNKKNDSELKFLQWALPRMGYRWSGFRKPRGQVLKRIRGRIQDLELSGGFSEYKEYLQEHTDEWKVLDRLCDVTISKFFRDRKLWDFLHDHILPALCGNIELPLSVWSAGCCNGEEPYSFAIIYEQLSEQCNVNSISILATDRNAKVLERARRGEYPCGALKELTEEEINRFFHYKGNDEDRFVIKDFLKKYINFEQRDIRRDLPEGPFQLVFCRNLVFTYFDKQEQQRFLDQLKPKLLKGSYLVIGSNETLPKEENWLQPVRKTHPVFQYRK